MDVVGDEASVQASVVAVRMVTAHGSPLTVTAALVDTFKRAPVSWSTAVLPTATC